MDGDQRDAFEPEDDQSFHGNGLDGPQQSGPAYGTRASQARLSGSNHSSGRSPSGHTGNGSREMRMGDYDVTEEAWMPTEVFTMSYRTKNVADVATERVRPKSARRRRAHRHEPAAHGPYSTFLDTLDLWMNADDTQGAEHANMTRRPDSGGRDSMYSLTPQVRERNLKRRAGIPDVERRDSPHGPGSSTSTSSKRSRKEIDRELRKAKAELEVRKLQLRMIELEEEAESSGDGER